MSACEVFPLPRRLRHPLRSVGPLAALALGVPGGASAQVSVGAYVALLGSSNLVHDSIVQTIDIRPALAPQVGLRVQAPFSGRYSIAADVAVSRSDLQNHGDTAATTITTLTVWSPSVALSMAATSWLAVEARLAGIFYDPGQTVGTLFSAGSPVEPAVGLGIVVERPLGGRFGGQVAVRYDAHRFTTNALQTRGFTGKTVVHRVALGVTLFRRFGGASK